MSVFTSFFDKLKSHNYSIITAVIIGIITAVYLMIIVPNNEKKEDTNNIAIFKGIEGQLKSFINDKLQGINEEQMKSIYLNYSKEVKKSKPALNSGYYIDKIVIDRMERKAATTKKLLLIRKIYFKKNMDLKIDTLSVKDSVEIDLNEFINRIKGSSNFKSFFICPVIVSEKASASTDNNKKEPSSIGKCLAKDVLISENINAKDEDSLCFYNRNEGHIEIKDSDSRFYGSQVRIPDTDFTLFFAAGVSSSYFKSNVQYIKPSHLIFGLLLISILFLSICLIKPIALSYKELLSQMDLIRVVFSIGALISIFVIFGMVGFWKTTISNRNKSDLKQLVEYIDGSFKNQVKSLKNYKEYKKSAETHKDSNFYFRNFANPDSSEQIKFLDVYFWMNKDGLLTASLDKDSISFPRKFNDRDYFKYLQNKEINTVLTGVFSRERDEFQWIYAEKDLKSNDKGNSTEKYAIKGIAFREKFSKEIKLSPDTDYMLVDRAGNVLTQYNPGNLNKSSSKKLYQNVLSGSNNNLVLASVLAGCNIQKFKMDYQGSTYQVYAKRLGVKTDLPVYILGIRNLSYLDYLSQFTFINSILIVLAYGLLLILLILIYSSFFYSNRVGFFAREHFYHLFHDYSKKEEYKHLFWVNCICFFMALAVFLVSSPITALYFCLMLSFNITFINVFILNSRYKTSKDERFILYVVVLIFSFAVPLFLLHLDHLYISILVIIISHLGIIRVYQKWKSSRSYIPLVNDAIPDPKVVQRKAYLRFVTAVFTNHFIMFPFVLVCVFYSNEINDYVRYYCSPSQLAVSNTSQKGFDAYSYGCDCKNQDTFFLNVGANNEDIIHKLNFGFTEPTTSEIRHYTLKEVSKKFYIMIRIIFIEAGWNFIFILLGFVVILLFGYSLLNYYSNRFFFFELMQVSYAGYYPFNKVELTDEQEFIGEVFDSSTKILNVESESETLRNEIKKAIEKAFANDEKNEITAFYRDEFKINSELKYFEEAYSKIWQYISNKETHNVLYDFAQDFFSNYKNKDVIMHLMDLGLINHNETTGRMQIRSESFRKYILLKKKQDIEFVEEFKKDSSDGTFSKLKIPMLIIATSLLLLLMYLNKDSYEKVAVMGTSIGSALLLVNRFLSIGKS